MGVVIPLKSGIIKPALSREQFLAMFTDPAYREKVYQHFDEKYEEQEDDNLYKYFRRNSEKE